MPLKFSQTLRNARATAILNAIDSGGNATIEFYDFNQTLLAIAQLPVPCALVSNGVLVFNQIPAAIAITNGFIEIAKIKNSNETVIELDVGDVVSTAAIRFENTEAKEGGSVIVASAAITEGNA
jgi:hypothetical protein